MSLTDNKLAILEHSFGQLADGRAAKLYTLRNANGLLAKITNYGAILTELHAPDNTGKLDDIVLGRASLNDYEAGHPYFGAIVGRVAGRISRAQFKLNQKIYRLPANNGSNCLHGGPQGFDRQLWDARSFELDGQPYLELSYIDPDGSNGFPGNLKCRVCYSLSDTDELRITYWAQCDQACPLNLTNHSYFNLNGHQAGPITDHQIQLFADHRACAATDGTLLGKKVPVEQGLNDFRQAIRLGSLQALDTRNADTHYFLPAGRTAEPTAAAKMTAPISGRVLEAWTTEPGLQFYAGLHLNEATGGKNKNHAEYPALSGFCLETQDYPDAVNQPELGHNILLPGQTFESTTCFRFSTTESIDLRGSSQKLP